MVTDAVEPATGSNPSLVYLDSNFYLDYLQGDRPGHAAAEAVVEAWKSGQVELATSSLTLTEVLYVKIDDVSARVMIPREREADIIDLFRPYGARRFRLIELDRVIAEAARQVVWDHGIHPKDAIHVASALRGRVPVMFTRDGKLLRTSGKVGGNPLLTIVPPAWNVQTTLGLDADAPLS